MKHQIIGLKTLILICFVYMGYSAFAQKDKQFQIAAVGFYNLENLFDTIDTPGVHDTEFTPGSKKLWNTKNYNTKLQHLAKVISEIATDKTPDGLAVLGVSEVENREVLEDLVKQEAIKDRNYQIIHYHSPDKRGIDVALLYRADYFTPSGSRSVALHTADTSFHTRDQLVVSGELQGENIHFIVNHWPSRSGGEKRSRPLRNAAAQLCKSITDSILTTDANAKVIIMGDLNDDPTSPSVARYLKAVGDKKLLSKKTLYNPFYTKFMHGEGSLAYRDSWNIFDQMIMTPALVKQSTNWMFYKAYVFNKSYMKNETGRYKGYPKRYYVGNTIQGGYSDHFPVYLYLVREVSK